MEILSRQEGRVNQGTRIEVNQKTLDTHLALLPYCRPSFSADCSFCPLPCGRNVWA